MGEIKYNSSLSLLFLESGELVHENLLVQYKKLKISEAERFAYRNASVIHSEWKLGMIFWNEGQCAPLPTKPLLLFYGLSHFLKAAALYHDPHYPSSSEVLAHGITTRKRKRRDYSFLQDEIKVQKNGFYPYFAASMFHMKHRIGESWAMRDMLVEFSKLLPVFISLPADRQPPKIDLNEKSLLISAALSLKQKQALSAWLTKDERTVLGITETKGMCRVHISKPVSSSLFLNDKGNYYLNYSMDRIHLPELCMHYCLLFNLSILCRYEAEWWSDFIHHQENPDFPVIRYYMNTITAEVPRLFEPLFQ
ncbi:YaaC family protein [Alteribacillus sp. HJP-4]|uniref:YaaC family protein n=1 Tax=Alteribacillus sp. HJP-4 TaxID=2775394 RepID=UPI0035CCF3E8